MEKLEYINQEFTAQQKERERKASQAARCRNSEVSRERTGAGGYAPASVKTASTSGQMSRVDSEHELGKAGEGPELGDVFSGEFFRKWVVSVQSSQPIARLPPRGQ